MKLASAALIVMIAVLWVASASAATVGIVRPSSGSPQLSEALYRLQGELLAVGLRVEIAERPLAMTESLEDSRARAELERIANERGLSAIFDISGEEKPTAIEIWMFQRSPQRVEVARVTSEPNAPRPSETLAIRAIEVLRSSFLELDLAERARPPQPEPSQPTVDRAEQTQPPTVDRAEQTPRPSNAVAQWGLEAGAAVVSGVNGVGSALLPLVRLDWVPLPIQAPWLATQATFAGLGTRPTIETARGSADVSQVFGLVGACYCPPFTGVRPTASLAAGALRTALDGRAALPARGHGVVRWALLMDASLGARLRLSEQYFATLAAHVQLAEPYLAIHFADRTVATTGRPNLLFTLTFGAWL